VSTRAEGTFLLTGWDENTYEELEGGAKLTRARISQDFSGDLQGSGTWESTMCYRTDGTADYVGFERIVGTLHGRTGSFVVRADGAFDGTVATSTWTVVEGSGAGELRGLRGVGESAAPHGPNGTYALDYDLD
jgi:Protein of unknown function (DUF3224)